MKIFFVRTVVYLYQKLFRKWFRRSFLKKKISILLYHEITPDLFDQHLDYLQQTYNIISLKQLCDALENGESCLLPDNPLVLTIDDGWKSNYELLKVVKKYDCPLTIFLLAGLVGTNRIIWNYTLERLGGERDFNTRLKATPNKEKNKILLKHNGYFPEKEYENRRFLNLDEIKEMKNHIDFQSHGMFHPVFPMCNEDELNFELSKSKEVLEQLLGVKPYAFAYPYGRQGTREVNFVRQHGYRLARVASNPGLNTIKSDPFVLKCIGVKSNSSLEKLQYMIARIELLDLYRSALGYFLAEKIQ